MTTKLDLIRHPVGLFLMVLGFYLTACQPTVEAREELGGEVGEQASRAITAVSETLHMTPHLVEADDGTMAAAEWGHILVPENRSRPDSRLIEVAFIRLKTAHPNPTTPIFYLHGGPGEAALAIAPNFVPFMSTSPFDFVLIEQRGIGHSRPRLDCPDSYHLSLDRPLVFETWLQVDQAYYESCAKWWQRQGVDITGYNTQEMAADVDALRDALGYGQISLLGGSFGSHHGIAILKSFGDYVDRAILSAVEGPDHTMKLPSTIQAHLQKLDDKLKSDASLHRDIPDLLALMSSVLDQLAQQPITWQIADSETGESESVTLGKLDLQIATAHGLGQTAFLRNLPSLYFAMSQGDYSWLAQWAIGFRRGRGVNLMGPLVDCASGATQERRALVEKEATETLLGDAINDVQFARCDVLGQIDLGDEFRADLQSDIPVLLVSGSLDARTPVSNAEAVLQGLPQGQHLILEGVSHDLELDDNLFGQYIQRFTQFLLDEPLSSTELVVPFHFDPLKDN